MEKKKVSIFWFRRDLRLEDNAALYNALKSGNFILPIFIFDTNILSRLEDKKDKRVDFIWQVLNEINEQLKVLGSSLLVKVGTPEEVYLGLLDEYEIKGLFCNHDYEPKAIQRDNAIKQLMGQHNVPFFSFKDQVIFEKEEITKDDGRPYTVFTPYSKKWKAKLNSFYLKSYPSERYLENFLKETNHEFPLLAEVGFEHTGIEFTSPKVNEDVINAYHLQRDFPAIIGTSRLSVHLRFGTISIRKLANTAFNKNETWLNELIWRDFYMSILWHFPMVETSAFKPQYEAIQWRNNVSEFEAWCKGETGYPIVDAGMRELNTTGFMHNRVRMIVASFLTKHLLIDWRWGEAYFAQKLLDFDLAANNGGWQWAAGTGCDAAPYFRIFNPYEQTKKFDSHLQYIKKWVPEFQEFHYPKPIVEHKFARERVLSVYKNALQSENFKT